MFVTVNPLLQLAKILLNLCEVVTSDFRCLLLALGHFSKDRMISQKKKDVSLCIFQSRDC